MNRDDLRCVLLADRHTGLTEGVRGLLESVFPVVVTVADETSLLESARRIGPVLAVVDLSLTSPNVFHWFVKLQSSCPQVKVIVLSVHDEPSVCQWAMGMGASAFVVKRDVATDLLPAIDAVLGGTRYVSKRMAKRSSAEPNTEKSDKPD